MRPSRPPTPLQQSTTWLCLSLAWACGGTVEPTDVVTVDTDLVTVDTDAEPARAALTLLAPDPPLIVLTTSTRFTVAGATPRQGITLYAVDAALPLLQDCLIDDRATCLALQSPDVVSTAESATNGHAYLSLRLDAPAPERLALQAASADDARWSGVLVVPVLHAEDDDDGDGISNVDEVTEHATNPLLADSDDDGLSDGAEVELGSDPLAPDTDGDGLPDGAEVAIGASPLLTDTDGDGLDDLQESLLGSNPTSSDSDDDGIDDAEEVALGLNPAQRDTDDDGLSDPDELELWLTDPRNPDTDGDGLRDGHEANLSLTSPLRPDTDADTLTDGDEVLVHATNPLLADTDHGGRDDNVEIDAGTDPNNPNDDPGAPCPAGYVSDCGDQCRADTLGDGQCDPHLQCLAHSFDQGDCSTATRTIEGDVEIPTTHEAADLADVHTITGTLTIAWRPTGFVSLPNLVHLGGLDVLSSPFTPAHVRAPLLEHIHGRLFVSPVIRGAQQLVLPSLHTIDGTTNLHFGPDTNNFFLPAWTHAGDTVTIKLLATHFADAQSFPLQTVHGDMVVRICNDEPNRALHFPQLTQVTGTLTATDCEGGGNRHPPATFTFDALTQVGALDLNASQSQMSLPQLTTLPGPSTLIAEAQGAIDLPLLTHASSLDLVARHASSQLLVPELTTVDHNLTVVNTERGHVDLRNLTEVSNLVLASETRSDWTLDTLLRADAITITHPAELGAWPWPIPERSLNLQSTVTAGFASLAQLSTISASHLTLFHTLSTPSLHYDGLQQVALTELVAMTSAPTVVTEAVHASLSLDAVNIQGALVLSQLTDTPQLSMATMAGMHSVRAPKLTDVGETLSLRSNPFLASIELPVLTHLGSASTLIKSHPRLTQLVWPSVVDVGGTREDQVAIRNNIQLSTCELQQWAAPFSAFVTLLSNGPC